MNFRHLKIFITVCEVGNMTRAAKELNMAQPSVSQAIMELEKYYGVHLFERLNHRLYLTAAGERLRSYARQILNLSEQAQKELADLRQGGSLRIGASLTIGAYLLPGLVADFHQQNPQVEVFTRVDNTNLIEQRLLEDKLDLGLVEGPTVSAYITEEFLSYDDLVFIASPQHPLVKSGKRTAQDLAGLAFIVREAGSGTQTIFEQAMREAGVNWKTAGVYNNNQAIKQAVSANLGLGMVSKIAIAEEVQLGKLVPLEIEGIAIKRKFNLVYHQQKIFTRAMQLFRDAIKTALRS
jgi:LysR family transcriptional regulator, transcriptional activator of the cysJI operon